MACHPLESGLHEAQLNNHYHIVNLIFGVYKSMYVMLHGCGKLFKGIIDLYVTRFGVYIILFTAYVGVTSLACCMVLFFA
jgi:hypothetical protein